MCTYTEQLNELLNNGTNQLCELIEKHGSESRDYNVKCLKVVDEAIMYNLDSSYLVEITTCHLIDNNGNLYNHSVLNAEQLCELSDHYISVYKEY